MKTSNYWPAFVSTTLATALLFGTAWSVAAIDFSPPKVPDSLTNIQKDIDKAAARKPTLTLASGVPQGSTATLKWDAGGAQGPVQIRVKVNDGGEGAPFATHTSNMSVGTQTFSVSPGTSVFTLVVAGQRSNSVTVKFTPSAPSKPNTSTPTPTASVATDESASSNPEDQEGKHKKKKNKNKSKKNRKHRHHDNDEEQGND